MALDAPKNNLRMKRPFRSTKVEEDHLFHEKIRLKAIQDHILESQCQHVVDTSCMNDLAIPQLPEMIFPSNSLVLSRRLADGTEHPFLEFNTFDALRMVQVGELPNLKVKPSETWQRARQEIPLTDFQKPFDWTYTSLYKGSVIDSSGIRVEPTNDAINFEKLKRREPILFYTQMTLFEDELSDHGSSQMTVRVRVMPSCLFILCRFYLRIDDVLVRIFDTRLYTEVGWTHLIRECSSREANFDQLSMNDLRNVLDANLIWQSLPQISMERTKLIFET